MFGFDFDHAVTAPFRMQPGLRRVDAQRPLLTPVAADGHQSVLREKLRILRDHSHEALLATAGFDAGAALAALLAECTLHHPQALRRVDDRRFEAAGLGWSLDDGEPVAAAGADPAIGTVLRKLPTAWRLPALLALAFEEDLAIIDGRQATVPWLAVCLPSFWSPAHKVGRHFVQIHDPVADGTVLRAAGEHLMRLVSGPQRWERFGWTLTPHAQRAAHPRIDPRAAWPATADPEALARLTWLRTEHQVFLPVPAHAQAVFTIRVGLVPLPEAVCTPERAQRLHDALATMSPAVLDYRGLTPARERLLKWLQRP